MNRVTSTFSVMLEVRLIFIGRYWLVFRYVQLFNVLGVPFLGKHHFKDQADANSLYDDDGTTIKSGSTKAHFIWDHGKHERHFFIGDSDLPELYLYVGQGYFKAFCTRVRKYFDDQVIHAFSSALSIDPAMDTDMPCPEGDDLQNPWEDPPHQWYCPEIVTGTASQAPSSTNKPTKPNSSSCDFKLGMDLMYRDGKGKNVPSSHKVHGLYCFTACVCGLK